MNRKSRILISFFLIVVFLLSISCSLIPAGVADIFATKTNTSVPTPTDIPTSTATPLPTVDFYSCRYSSDCPQAVGIGDYVNGEYNGSGYQVVSIPYDRVIHFSSSWIAKDNTILEKNIQSIKWVLKIDGIDYFTPDLLQAGVSRDKKGDGVAYPGMWLGVVLEGWEIDVAHEIEIGFILEEAVYDGWAITKAGTSFVTKYQLVPAWIPTPTITLTPTITPSPTPTNTLTPTWVIIYPTVQPAATTPGGVVYNLTITVINNTTSSRKVVFTGPMTLTFNLSPGQTMSQQAVRGSYKYSYTVSNGVLTLTFGPVNITGSTLCYHFYRTIGEISHLAGKSVIVG